MRLKQPHLD